MNFPSLSIRTRLQYLVLAAALPFMVLLGWYLHVLERNERDTAYAQIGALASTTAGQVELVLLQNAEVMAQLAKRPIVRELNPLHCDPAMADYLQIHPEIAAMTVRDLSGGMICAVYPGKPSTALPVVAHDNWFAESVQRGKFTVGNAVQSRASGRWISVLTQPVWDSQGQRAAVLSMPLDLMWINARLVRNVPVGTMVAVLDRNDAYVLRSNESQDWIGKAIPQVVMSATQGQRQGSVTMVGVDGVARMYSYLRIPGSEWLALAGMPLDVAMADYRHHRNMALLTALAVFLVAMGLATRIAAGISRPVRSLANVVDRMAKGDLSARVVVTGPTEIAQVGHEFNQMLDARIQALNDLRTSEARWKFALEGSGDGLWDCDLVGNTIFFSPRWAAMLGYAPHELLPTPEEWLARVHPDDLAAVQAHLEAHLEGGEASYAHEYRVRCKDGHYKWLLSRGLVVSRNAAGKALRMVGTNSDITERKTSEQALRTALDLLEYSQAAAKVGGWQLDIASGHLYWTAETYRIHETSPAEFNPTVDAGVGYFLPGSRERIGQALQAAIERGEGYALELETLTTKGKRLDVFTTCAVTQVDGKPATLTGIFQDITERKKAQKVLSESEGRLAGVIDSAMDAIVSVDSAHRVVLFNSAAEKMFGFAAADMLGQPLDRLIPTSYRATHSQHMSHYGSTVNTSRAMGALGQLSALRCNGDEFPIEASISQVNVDGKKIFTVIVRDITQRKAAEQALLATNAELARSNEELEQFAHVASHDLQEPLRSISSSVQLLKRRCAGALDARGEEFIAHAVGGVQRMQMVIDDLLAYSRIGAAPQVMKSIDLNAALQVAQANLAQAIAASHAVVSHDDLPHLMANPIQLAQLFQNLVGNALKFRGDKPARVHVGALQEGAEWVISVADHGIGIEPQYFERIFKLFQRLHTRTEYAGTGIGLTICQKIVERHGGRIWVESTLGQGSTFFFTLPVGKT